MFQTLPIFRSLVSSLLLLALLAGCATVPCADLGALRDQRQKEGQNAAPGVDSLPPGSYQVGLRLSEDLVNRTLAQAVAGGALPRKFDREFGADLPLPDFIDKRIPGIRVTAELAKLALHFRSDCQDCIGLEVGTRLSLGFPDEVLALETRGEGKVSVYGRAHPEGARIFAALSRLADFRLDLASQVGKSRLQAAFGPRIGQLSAHKAISVLEKLPGAGDWMVTALTSLVDQLTTASLRTVEFLIQKAIGDVQLFTLPSYDIAGLPVHIVRIDTTSLDGALFLGADTDLPGAAESDVARSSLPQQVPDDRRSRVTRSDVEGRPADLSMAISPGFLRAAVGNLYRRGKLPLRYNGRGKPDPQGGFELDLLSLSGTGDGLELGLRVWDLAKGCGTVDLTCTARVGVGEKGALSLGIEGLRAISADGTGKWLALGVGLWTGAVRGPVDWMGEFSTAQRLALQGLEVQAQVAGLTVREGRLVADWGVQVSPQKPSP